MTMTLTAFFRPKQFTGYHMLATIVTFFAVIIGVNLVMASYAISTWTGLVVPNTYIASQEFNGKAAESRAISALGYQGEIASGPDGFTFALSDKAGDPVTADAVLVAFNRPVGAVGDHTMTLTPRGEGVFAAPGKLVEGEWIAHVSAVLDGATIYRAAYRIHTLADGSLRQ
ncbi:nitrogen fixation protein FixH [Hoeflea marina]|uniref:Nitrogen fixation protein FixH n=1 Tax=Hoeflea marina TaxID=274592 RepID=A0A317PCH4_9HYPH|nr:FixH family protein [Hoeflea marina]PWV95359.1 nitrogen fixation protein FixH [Hoeflea marina]